jgi:surface polysaccharide O-acyltransferase-like enzyme
MTAKQRLAGIDVFRGLAIYAVIILHIDEGIKILPPSWLRITDFASFCVPFFLAAAFYLAIIKLYTSQSPYPLCPRLVRLLIPYGVWSAFYLLYKSAKYAVAGEPNKVWALFQDPLSLAFFGGASYHLYFLPLLVTGTLLVKLVEFLIKRKITLKRIGLIVLISLLAYEMILVSGNGLKAPANVAFEPLLAVVFPEGNSYPPIRWLLVEVVWALGCLPFVMVAMLLSHPTVNKFYTKILSQYFILVIVIFLAFNLFGTFVLPKAVAEIGRGYTALSAAIALSSVLKENALIKSIGLCSFGIYLVHIFFVETFQSIAVRLYPDYVNSASTLTLLTGTTLVLLSSWIATLLLMRNKRLSQILYGA